MTDSLQVRGGFTGTAARLQDLFAAERALRSASDALADGRARLAHAAWLAETASGEAAGYHPEAIAAHALVTDAAECAGGLACELGGAAARLGATARGYLEAERGASLVSAWWDFATDSMRWWGQDLADSGILSRLYFGGIFDPVSGDLSLPRVVPDRDATDATVGALGPLYAALLDFVNKNAAGLAWLFGDPFGLTITPERRSEVCPATGVEGLYRTLHGLEPAGGGNEHEFAIDKIVNPDGTVAWVVTIPGTQDWPHLGGKNSFDGQANGLLAAQEVADPAIAVAAAMSQAGIAPGDPVMLVGHSQGGMTAMLLANQPGFRERYSVTSIVTAGSPTAGYATPPGVAVLHLEHEEDIVPGADGGRNAPDLNRVTVSRELDASSDPTDRSDARGAVTSHHSDVYARTGALVDASEDPAIVEWRDDSQVFFEGGTATRSVYSVERGLDATFTASANATEGSVYVRSTAG